MDAPAPADRRVAIAERRADATERWEAPRWADALTMGVTRAAWCLSDVELRTVCVGAVVRLRTADNPRRGCVWAAVTHIEPDRELRWAVFRGRVVTSSDAPHRRGDGIAFAGRTIHEVRFPGPPRAARAGAPAPPEAGPPRG